jgi:uncharacterized protein DUF4397
MRKLLMPTIGGALLLTFAVGATAAGTPRESTVTIVHGLPGFTADVYLEGDLILDGFRPTQATDPMRLAPGTYDLAIRELGAPADSRPVLEGSVTLKPRSNISIVAHLTADGTETVSVFDNAFDRLPAGSSYLVVRDVASAPPFSIRLDQGLVVPSLGPGQERITRMDPGRYDLAVVSKATNETLMPATTIRLDEGAAQIVYVIGSEGSDSLDVMLQSVRGLHSSPRKILSGDGGLAADPSVPWWVFPAIVAGVALVAAAPRLGRRRA